ncbi:hypothetical protein [Paraglaciecola sp. 20A4]|uniref:hypothetical protein n=1 Tax=Paraglaciecola sp. 20A4 TaxID=2687288 RepID=UPI00140D9550|nr:hypothetical protein [Paraglaciecola sp. 20A4]
MPHYLIKAEAVNLDATFSQSDNISMFRAASLTLRDAVKQLHKNFDCLEKVSIGASIGLFSVENCTDITQLVSKIKAFINEHYRAYTFVVNAVEVDKSRISLPNSNREENIALFGEAKEALITAGRRAQLQQSTIAYAPVSALNSAEPVCELTHILVADTTLSWQNKVNRPVNSEAKKRFIYGKENKQQFYRSELSEFTHSDTGQKLAPPAIQFTDNLEALSGNGPNNQLSNKLAYIYLDGNKFSKLQQLAVHSIDEQILFDNTMQRKRAQLLHDLLHWASQKQDFKTQNTDGSESLRLETLLWGGDEMLLVVPAWLGFETLGKIFELTQGWQYSFQKNDTSITFPLTHAAGLVFCKKGTPVYRMRKLARKLADNKKHHAVELDEHHHNLTSQDRPSPEQNALPHGLHNTFDFLVLESVDYANEKLAPHFEKRYSILGLYRNATFCEALSLTSLDKAKHKLKLLSKSQVYALAKAAMPTAKPAMPTAKPAMPTAKPAMPTAKGDKLKEECAPSSKQKAALSREKEEKKEQDRIKEPLPFIKQKARFCDINGFTDDQYNALLATFSPLLIGNITPPVDDNNREYILYGPERLLWVLLTEIWEYLLAGEDEE